MCSFVELSTEKPQQKNRLQRESELRASMLTGVEKDATEVQTGTLQHYAIPAAGR